MTRTPAERIRSGERLLGTLLRMPGESLVELTGLVGMDFVLIDTEHGPADQLPLAHHLTAATAAGIGALVRVGNLSEVLRVLDLGADGIVVPHVSTPDRAREVVAAARYPPTGVRGFASYTRAGRFGLRTGAEHRDATARGTAVIVMLEDEAGIAAAAEIAAVPGVDAVWVGPADLAVAMGESGPDAPAVRDAIAVAHERIRLSGTTVLSIAGSRRAAAEQFEAGSGVVVYNLQAALNTLFTELSAAAPGVRPDLRRGAGAGAAPPPMLLLPGTLGTDALWDGVLGALGDDAAPVFGRIDLDDTIAGMAESVLAAAPASFDLVGHSLGGIVALEMARLAPDRIRRMVLLNTSGRAPSGAQQRDWADLSARTCAGDFRAVLDEQMAVNLGAAGTDPVRAALWQSMARAVGVAGYLRQLRAQQGRSDYLPELPGIAVPTLVVTGAEDSVCPRDVQLELAARLPDARHVVVPGAGHLSPLDAPADIAALLRDFLR